MLFALCVSAEAQQPDKDPAHRICGERWRYQQSRAHRRGLSARAPRSRLHRREKHCCRVSLPWSRPPKIWEPSWPNSYNSRSMPCQFECGSNPCSPAGDQNDSHCHGDYIDPVEAGIVDSLARPGGNITGVTRLTQELSGKRLELLKEAVPRIS